MNSRMEGNDLRMQKSRRVEQGRAGSSGQHFVKAFNQRTELAMIWFYLWAKGMKTPMHMLSMLVGCLSFEYSEGC